MRRSRVPVSLFVVVGLAMVACQPSSLDSHIATLEQASCTRAVLTIDDEIASVASAQTGLALVVGIKPSAAHPTGLVRTYARESLGAAWRLLNETRAPDELGVSPSAFGDGVALSRDASVLVVVDSSATSTQGARAFVGRAFTFKRDSALGDWRLVGAIVPGSATSRFSANVALSGDGKTLAIGGTRVQTFVRTTTDGTWRSLSVLVAPSGAFALGAGGLGLSDNGSLLFAADPLSTCSGCGAPSFAVYGFSRSSASPEWFARSGWRPNTSGGSSQYLRGVTTTPDGSRIRVVVLDATQRPSLVEAVRAGNQPWQTVASTSPTGDVMTAQDLPFASVDGTGSFAYVAADRRELLETTGECSSSPGDAGSDAHVDGGTDAGLDSGADARSDSASDVGVDAHEVGSASDAVVADAGDASVVPSPCPVPRVPSGARAAYEFDGQISTYRVLGYGIAASDGMLAINHSWYGDNGGFGVGTAELSCDAEGLRVATPFSSVFAPGSSEPTNAPTGFGRSLAFADDGSIVVGYSSFSVNIGQPGQIGEAGTVEVYRSVNGRRRSAQRLMSATPTAGAKFGYAVAVSGSLLFVGSLETGSGSGLVEVFRRGDNGEYSAITSLRNPNGALNDTFGCGLASDSERLWVGSCGYDQPGISNTGRVFVYRRTESAQGISFQYERAVLPPTPEAGANFGRAIVAAGRHLFVGAPGHRVDGVANAGAVHQFQVSGTSISFVRSIEGYVSRVCNASGFVCETRATAVGHSLSYWRGYLLYGLPGAFFGRMGWEWVGAM